MTGPEPAGGGARARVVRQDRGWVVADVGGDVVRARDRGDRTGGAVVGDWVTIEADEVVEVLERRSVLRRADPAGDGEQVLAANVDRVLAVAGLDRPVKEGRIQRALAQAHDAPAEPLFHRLPTCSAGPESRPFESSTRAASTPGSSFRLASVT